MKVLFPSLPQFSSSTDKPVFLVPLEDVGSHPIPVTCFFGPCWAHCAYPTSPISFQVDLDSGLSEMAVAQRRLVHGWNEFVTDNAEPVWKKYLDQVGAGCRPLCQ